MDLIRLTNKRPDHAITEAVQTAIGLATSEWAPLVFEGEFPKTGFGIGKLRARDIAVTNQQAGLNGTGVYSSIMFAATFAAASTWAEWLNINIDDRLYVVVTGLQALDPNPAITAMRFRAGGEDLPVLPIEELYTYDMARAYLSKPFIIQPGNNMTCNIVGTRARAGVDYERLGLLGFAIAKRAYLIIQ